MDVQSTKDEPLDFGVLNLLTWWKINYEIPIRVFVNEANGWLWRCFT